jgi:hypothetical protein
MMYKYRPAPTPKYAREEKTTRLKYLAFTHKSGGKPD